MSIPEEYRGVYQGKRSGLPEEDEGVYKMKTSIVLEEECLSSSVFLHLFSCALSVFLWFNACLPSGRVYVFRW